MNKLCVAPETILAILFPLVAHGHPQLVSASGHPEHGSGDRLLARGRPFKESGCRFDTQLFLPFLMRCDGCLGCHSYEEPISSHKLTSESSASDSSNH